MFWNCSSLTSLDLRSFAFSSGFNGALEKAKYMFSYCKNLKTLMLGSAFETYRANWYGGNPDFANSFPLVSGLTVYIYSNVESSVNSVTNFLKYMGFTSATGTIKQVKTY